MQIEALVGKLSVKGPQLDGIPGGRARGSISWEDVAAACAFGDLPAKAYLMGRRLYANSGRDRESLENEALFFVDKLFDRGKWDRSKTIARLAGELNTTHDLAVLELKKMLINLAMIEIENNGNCRSCNGTGVAKGRKCKLCAGGGKKEMSIELKASWCQLKRPEWRTWGARYTEIYRELRSWANMFDQHLLDQAR